MEIVRGAGWDCLAENLLLGRGTVVLIGTTDAGKSTLARFLISRCLVEGEAVGLVDADIGQSSLGLPGAVSMKVFEKGADLESFIFERMSFVGSLSPATRIGEMIDQTRGMVRACRDRAGIVIVDTTGLVAGDAGRALKVGKILAIRPEHVVALQREKELNGILNAISDRDVMHLYHLGISPLARQRSRASRIKYRSMKFRSYFERERMREFLLRPDQVTFIFDGRPFVPVPGEVSPGRVIGLNCGEDTLALGYVIEAGRTGVALAAPIGAIGRITRLVFGDFQRDGRRETSRGGAQPGEASDD